MNNNAANNFNFVAGVLGFAITVVSAAAYCRSYLPGVQMKILDELLKETRTIYEQVEADNLFPSEILRKGSWTTLVRLEDSSAALRESAYNATTSIKEYQALFKGLSRSIIHLADSVKDLRASLISTSEKERRSRRAEREGRSLNSNAVDNRAAEAIGSSFNPESERSSRGRPVDRDSGRGLGRSASCPPALKEFDQSLDCLRESLARLEEGQCQGVAQQHNVASSNNPSRSSTLTMLVDRPPQGIFRKTLDRWGGWIFVNPDKSIFDIPLSDEHDIARLPV